MTAPLLEPDDELGEAYEDEAEYPLEPTCDLPDAGIGARWVDYTDRGPADVLLSGPVTGGWGPGRWHKNRRLAYAHCAEKYGAGRVQTVRQADGRWSFLIKNLRQA